MRVNVWRRSGERSTCVRVEGRCTSLDYRFDFFCIGKKPLMQVDCKVLSGFGIIQDSNIQTNEYHLHFCIGSADLGQLWTKRGF